MSAISDKHNDWTEPRTSCLGQARNPHVMEVLICETDSLGLADYLRILINNILPPGLIGASLL